MDRVAEVFDYGNSIRDEARKAGYDGAFDFPGFVPAYIRPQFERSGPVPVEPRSPAIPRDIAATDRTSELFPTTPTFAPLDHHGREVSSKVCRPYLLARLRRTPRAGCRSTDGGLRRTVRADRDRPRPPLDSGSVASPYRETESMADGSAAIRDHDAAERDGQRGLGCIVGVDPSRRQGWHGAVDPPVRSVSPTAPN